MLTSFPKAFQQFGLTQGLEYSLPILKNLFRDEKENLHCRVTVDCLFSLNEAKTTRALTVKKKKEREREEEEEEEESKVYFFNKKTLIS